MARRLLVATMLVLLLVPPAASAEQATSSGQRAQYRTALRVVWTLIGAGIGFGAGLMIGLHQFDDAIDSDRKVWTTALVTAAAGGIAGNLLSRDISPAARPPVSTPLSLGDYKITLKRPRASASSSRPASGSDRVWEGMLIGAAVGAVIGAGIVPATNCKPSNPECPARLRIGVGIPATAAGAALGALVDGLIRQASPPGPVPVAGGHGGLSGSDARPTAGTGS
jgi:hypothetical protein